MKFVFVDRLGAQAIWSLMNAIASALLSRGDEVSFVRWDDGHQRDPLQAPAGVNIHDIHVGSGGRIGQLHRFSTRFSRLLAEINPDVVHTNFVIPGALARRVAKRVGVPTVVTTCHELYGSMSPHLRLLTRLTERHADRVIYISQTVARSYGRSAHVQESNGASARHIVISNGIDIETFKAANIGDDERIPGRILCTGRLVPVKGYDVLLSALPKILARHPEAHLRLAGSGPDESCLRELAGRLNIVDSVEFLGWVNRSGILKELRQAALVAIPSGGEGFGLVAAEAMAAGVPIVASRIPIFEEVLGTDGECARLFACGDSGSLAEAICETLANPAAAGARRDRGLERVRERFSAGRMVAGYMRIYDWIGELSSLPANTLRELA